MPEVKFDVETTMSPEQVKAALLDFGDNRPNIWPGLAAEEYKVNSVGDGSADVREGTRMPGMEIWARETYDWTKPNTVRWTVSESNFCEAGSFMETVLEAAEGGGTIIHVTWNRTGSTEQGRAIIQMVVDSGGQLVKDSLGGAFRGMEAAAG